MFSVHILVRTTINPAPVNSVHSLNDAITQTSSTTNAPAKSDSTDFRPNMEEVRSWNDIIFENRNREYGAYQLRKGYASSLLTAILITMSLLMVVLFSPAIVSYLQKDQVKEIKPVRKLIYTELSAPPPIDKPKPPPPQVQLPKLQKVIKFVPPKVVKETIVEEVPTIEEIKSNQVADVNIEGPTEVVFDEPVQEVVLEDENEIFTVVEQRPEFEGGYEALMKFIRDNMQYPPMARRMQIEGTVHVSFVVNKDGSISDVAILRGISSECDKEALRVVNLMPKWKPGRQNGRNVNVRFVMPLKFRLS